MTNKNPLLLSLLLLLLFILNGNANSPMYKNGVSSPHYGGQILDETHFYGESNSSIYVVAVSSTHPIYIKDLDFMINLYARSIKETSNSLFYGCILTNTTYTSLGLGGQSEGNKIGNLRYLHFKYGRFNFTYQDRHTHNVSGFIGGEYYTEPYNHTLPAGTWYFIFTGGVFDLKQNDVIVETKVWINFSDSCKDLKIKTSEGGKIYALWYGEFDANIIISKAWTFEMMLNGKAKFSVNNTFVYTFWSWPTAQGFWRIKWIKPDGSIEKLNMLILREYHFPDIEGDCITGIGGSGDYELITSYLDYRPLLFKKHIYASPIYFIGLDIKLPEI